jgi:hypothetical protein
MVMTNVTKQSKTKFINIDTRFRDEYNYLQTANYNITLPERITDVSKMTLTNIEIPMSFYNISANIGNNCFLLDTSIITISDGYYDITSLKNAINNEIVRVFNVNPPAVFFDINGSKSSFNGTYTLRFDVNSDAKVDKYNFKSKLGWLLGFRNTTYIVSNGKNAYSEAFVDLNGPRYLYLAIDEFNKGNQYSFISPLYTSLINKNIIARISMDTNIHGFGTILPANNLNGLLVSDVRSYTGKIDLLKLNVQLLDENGNNVSLNGLDFSFCLEVEHE